MAAIIRAWVYSVLACIGVVAVFASIMQALTGRWEHAWHNVTDVTAAVSLVFAIVAAFVCVPSFLLLGRVRSVATDRRLMAALGTLLAPAVFIAFRIAFSESEDPRTTWGWIQHWVQHPTELAVGSLPFLIPGAIFGFTWSIRHQRPAGAG
jgi:hypothetical protein